MALVVSCLVAADAVAAVAGTVRRHQRGHQDRRGVARPSSRKSRGRA